METEWYLVQQHGEGKYGPFRTSELQALVDDGRLTPNDRLWSEGMDDWEPAFQLTHLNIQWPHNRNVPPPVDPFPMPASTTGDVRYDPTDRYVAAALAILLGYLGLHKFYYGATGSGIIMLLLSITCLGVSVTWPLAIIEGVIYLTKSPEEFHRLYRIEKKGWL